MSYGPKRCWWWPVLSARSVSPILSGPTRRKLRQLPLPSGVKDPWSFAWRACDVTRTSLTALGSVCCPSSFSPALCCKRGCLLVLVGNAEVAVPTSQLRDIWYAEAFRLLEPDALRCLGRVWHQRTPRPFRMLARFCGEAALPDKGPGLPFLCVGRFAVGQEQADQNRAKREGSEELEDEESLGLSEASACTFEAKGTASQLLYCQLPGTPGHHRSPMSYLARKQRARSTSPLTVCGSTC